MRIGLLQINPTICDLKGNALRIVQSAEKAFEGGAHFCLTPELAVIGYPPADLLYRRKVVEECLEAVKWIAVKTAEMGPILVGSPSIKSASDTLYNSAFLLNQGRIVKIFNKTLLPNYDVFDEQRYFLPAEKPDFFEVSGRKIGVTICEDVWNDNDFWEKSRYSPDPAKALAGMGVDFIVNLSASPFSGAKHKLRLSMLSSLSIKYSLPVIFCNQTGGNDELVFDGRSLALNSAGQVIAAAQAFKEDMLLVDLDDPGKNRMFCSDFALEEETWEALTLGLKDYVRKSGFTKVVLGLSGGIDSALVAALAVHALGSENVTGVLMPSPFSSQDSIDDSLELSRNLEIETITIAIDELMKSFDAALTPVFSGMARDVTEENIQARIRGNLLMAISNKLGSMVLATGNKSELAVGYNTIYGDMAGGMAPISDVPKTMVYAISRWLNTSGKILIPERIISKAPSAELSPGQKDQDTLPEYEILDQILHLHVQCSASEDEICAQGFSRQMVRQVLSMVKRAEFKRRQCPPGIKISDRAFGAGWRMPLASKCSFVTKK